VVALLEVGDEPGVGRLPAQEPPGIRQSLTDLTRRALDQLRAATAALD
jgi:hypothetical protein